MVPSPTARARWIALCLVIAATVACTGGGASDDGPCGPVRRESLDPRSVHVLPGADAPDYRTDPPTSGPHLPSPSNESVRTETLARPVQVGILEEGGVVIQHTGLSPAQQEEVEGLAGTGVVIAPADSLPDGAVVMATAWVTKQACAEVDVAALRTFIEDHADAGPGGHG